jgi:hypothetical protein
MAQLAAVQVSLERVQRLILRNHLSVGVSTALREGMSTETVDQLIGALTYSKGLIHDQGEIGLEGELGSGALAQEAARPGQGHTTCRAHEPTVSAAGTSRDGVEP